MSCHSKIKATLDKNGELVGELDAKHHLKYKYEWVCEGDCADKKHCKIIQGKPDHHGGIREWCGCPDKPEPTDCHLVVYKPGPGGGGGGAPEIFCAGNECRKDYHCPEKPSEEIIAQVPGGGKVVWLTCACVPDA